MELQLQDGGSSVGHRVATPPEFKGATTIDQLEDEVDHYLEKMQEFCDMQPDEVFLLLSAYTARATEIKIQLNRSDKARATSFRNRQIEPFLEECERQFKYHSRIQTTRELDFRISGGQT